MLLATTSRSPWLRRLHLIATVLCVARGGVQADKFSTRTSVDPSPNPGIDNLRGLRTVRPEPRNSSHTGVNTPSFPSDGGAVSAGSLLGARYVPVVNLKNPPTSGRRPGRDHRRRIERSLDLSSGASDWDDPGKYFSGAVRTFARRLWPAIQELVADDAVSTQCASSLLLLYAGVRRYRHWALNFVDASGRLPSGLLGGRAWDPGEYDQCLSIAAVLEGSYCTVRWNISRTAFVSRLTASAPPRSTRQHEPFNNIRLGLCVPSLCSTSHIQAVVDKVLQRQNASAVVSSCHSRSDFSVSHVQLFLVCLLCIWLTLIASSTLMHLLWNLKKAWPKDPKPTFFVRLVVAVSAVTSLTRLVAIDRSKHYSKTVDVLKVISVLWIVLGITYQSKLPRGGAPDVKGWGGNALYSVTTTSNLGFTTAFLLSGFLVAPSLPPLRSLNGSIPKRLATNLGERYIRLTVPALFVLVVFWLLPLSVDGPLVEELLRPKLDACRRRWWTVPLHVNNLRGGDQVCYSPLWYVSCEMQIFLVTCLILVLLSRFPRAATVALVLLCFGLIAGLSATVPAGAFEPSPAASSSSPTDILPFLHAPTYIVGLLLARCGNKTRQFTQVTLAAIYAWACAGFLLALFWPLVWRAWPRLHGRPGAVLSLVGVRCLWTLCVAAIVYVAWTRRRVKSGLGRRTFTSLGRLSFGAYLCAWLLAAPSGIAARHPSESGQFATLREFAANSILSYAAAFLVYLLCDAPAKSLCAFLRRREGADQSLDDGLDRRVRFLSQLLGVEPVVAPRAPPNKALRRITSLRDIVLHL